MKKSKWLIVVAVVAMIAMMSMLLAGCGDVDDKTYRESIEGLTLENGEKLFNGNTVKDSLPQTAYHKIVMDHLNAPLPEGKNQKKVLFMGYDGYRNDGLINIMNNSPEDSAVMDIRSKGGLYFTYSGGVEGGAIQATSTAPSWGSMLTGGWKNYSTIDDNGYVKDADVDTFLTKAMDMGYKASFTASWDEHLVGTYKNDVRYAMANGLQGTQVEYSLQPDDERTLWKVLEYLGGGSAFEPDVLFFTLEYTDHAGHDVGFGNHKEEYVQASKDADASGRLILDALYARPTYETEDWLILIVTDHGGIKTWHGGQSYRERTTWMACNKPELVNIEELKDFALLPDSTITQG